jgi:soluble lytic murein transglycosylase
MFEPWMSSVLRALLVAGALAAWGSSAAYAAAAGGDEDFVAAREAFRVGDARKLDLHAARVKGHVLEPYVAYWQMRVRLDERTPAEVARFLATYADTPLAPRLRSDWLRALGRRADWALFDQHYPDYTGEELDITCYAIQSLLNASRSEALQQARALWFLPREVPEACTPLFAELVEAQRVSQDDIWTRVRTALELGRIAVARRAAEYLPPAERPDAKLLTGISTNPGGFLEKQRFELGSRAGRETAMFAAYRLARTAPQQAATHWSALAPRFSDEERAYVWGQIAYFGAMRHDPDALAWFERAGDLSDLQLAWKARAALRARDWTEVLAALDAMTGDEQHQATWRYWKARALRALGREDEALSLLKPLSREHHFYGQLALEELGGKVTSPPASYRPSAAEVEAMRRHPGLRRALELFRLSMRAEATREWIFAVREFDDRKLLAAAELARRHEIFDRAIVTAERTASVHDFELRYIAPYRDVLQPRTRQLGLDEAWVYGLIRQESRFIVDARSRVGASGLMQLMPATAKWVAHRAGVRNWRWSDVTQVDTNVTLGTYYLRHVLDLLDGHPVLASAAYNAGPGRARAWRADEPLEGAVFAETIPFGETRDYVKKVMANASYYAHNFSQQAQSLKQRIGLIEPRQRAVEPALADTP